MAQPLAVAPVLAARDFSSLVISEQRRIFLLCQRMLQDREEAESAAQDVFLKAHKALQSQALDVSEPAKWLTRIAVNTCLDRLRSKRWQFWRKRPAPQDEEIILTMAQDRGPNAEDRMFGVEIQRRLVMAMQTLSARQRAVFALKHFEDKSLEEIGEILGLEVGTVKAHMSRAVTKLRGELEDVYRSAKGRTTE
ncbi:MAG: RNA polymerase sigma factor [Candidatus Solibacter usitatus]|nr:RNA polymerase sigma factor [Candidatus Solibacter usitatus]